MPNLVSNGIKFAEADFWDSNPQLKFMSPFNEVFVWKGKSPEWTSKAMWAVYLLCDPSSKFARMPHDERVKEIEKHFMKGKVFHYEKIKACIDKYPDLVLTLTQKDFKVWEELIHKRTEFLQDKEYSSDTYEMLDRMLKDTEGIFKRFLNIKAEMEKEEAEKTTRGGMKQSAAEKGLL